MYIRKHTVSPASPKVTMTLFFPPVELHLELPDLLIQLGLSGFVFLRPLCTSCRENVATLLFALMFPVRELCGMHPVCTRELIDGLVPCEGFQRDTGVEFSAITFPLCRQFLSPHPSHLDTAFYLNSLSSFWGTLYL